MTVVRAVTVGERQRVEVRREGARRRPARTRGAPQAEARDAVEGRAALERRAELHRRRLALVQDDAVDRGVVREEPIPAQRGVLSPRREVAPETAAPELQGQAVQVEREVLELHPEAHQVRCGREHPIRDGVDLASPEERDHSHRVAGGLQARRYHPQAEVLLRVRSHQDDAHGRSF